MSTVADILTAVGYNLNRTIDANSEPTETECIKWIDQTVDWIVQTCAELGSEIGRTTGTITTMKTTITAATQASPCQITAASHGLATANTDVVTIAGIVGMTEHNNVDVTATVVDDDNFTTGVDASSYTAYSSGGYVYTATYDDLASDFYAPVVLVDEDSISFSGWIEQSTERTPLHLTTEKKKLEFTPGQIDEPSEFFLDGSNNMVFLQTPDAAYTIKIPYYQKQSITATTDTVPFLGIFDSLIVESVTNKYLYRSREDMGVEWNWFSFIRERATRILKLRKKTAVRIL